MRLERDVTAVDVRAAALDARFAEAPAQTILTHALDRASFGQIALVSSFGAEAVVLLHLVAQIDRDVPVLFLETGMLFPETLSYQADVADHLGLTDVRVLRPDVAREDPDGTLHRRDTDACCTLRKTRPLAEALRPFDAWITGRKRFQSGARAALPVFEAEPLSGRIKVNPLARWTPTDIAAHMDAHDLPRHPLVAHGYPSLGCAPCTSRVAEGEDTRAGRWRGEAKEECGIHFVNGRAVRPGAETTTNGART